MEKAQRIPTSKEEPVAVPNKYIAVTISRHVGLSYYLTVSDKGEIIHSNPPMAKLGSHA